MAAPDRTSLDVHAGVLWGLISGLFTPADSGIEVGQERRIVRSTRESAVFLP
jgi:hypothetical protein